MNNVETKTAKTALLMGVPNLLILLPACISGSVFGLVVALAINAAALFILHQLGKDKRSVSNAVSSVKGFFSSQAETDNVFRNIINGGAHIVDQILSCML
ncbi:MAG: hypothetical protein ACOYKA_01170 [Legionellaceae bacterium]